MWLKQKKHPKVMAAIQCRWKSCPTTQNMCDWVMVSENKETCSEIMSEIRVHQESHCYHSVLSVLRIDFSFIFILYLIKIRYSPPLEMESKYKEQGQTRVLNYTLLSLLDMRSRKPKSWKKIKLGHYFSSEIYMEFVFYISYYKWNWKEIVLLVNEST